MIPFDFAKSVILEAAEFEENAQRIARELRWDAEAFKQLAAALSAATPLSPVEALNQIAFEEGRGGHDAGEPGTLPTLHHGGV